VINFPHLVRVDYRRKVAVQTLGGVDGDDLVRLDPVRLRMPPGIRDTQVGRGEAGTPGELFPLCRSNGTDNDCSERGPIQRVSRDDQAWARTLLLPPFAWIQVHFPDLASQSGGSFAG